MLNEKEVKDIIFKAQMAGYPNKNIPEILAPLYTYVEQMESEINRLQVALDATIAEKERCRNLAVDWALKSDGFEMALRRCENMKLAHEFENLLQTTSIPVAVENVKELINIAEAAKELMNWHKSLTAEPKKETVVNKLKKLLISAGYNIIPSIATKEVSK